VAIPTLFTKWEPTCFNTNCESDDFSENVNVLESKFEPNFFWVKSPTLNTKNNSLLIIFCKLLRAR